jgi:hypothetical protein
MIPPLKLWLQRPPQDSPELFDGTLRVAFALHRSKAASDFSRRAVTGGSTKHGDFIHQNGDLLLFII